MKFDLSRLFCVKFMCLSSFHLVNFQYCVNSRLILLLFLIIYVIIKIVDFPQIIKYNIRGLIFVY